MREKNIQGVFNLESLMKRQLAAFGALCAKDCFDESYRYDWYDDETDNWWNYQCQYNTEEICIATIGSAVDTEK